MREDKHMINFPQDFLWGHRHLAHRQKGALPEMARETTSGTTGTK